MIPVLNELDVAYACVGNHDFDFGEEILIKLLAETKGCKWLLSNVAYKTSHRPLADCLEYSLDDINGIKVRDVLVASFLLLSESSLIMFLSNYVNRWACSR